MGFDEDFGPELHALTEDAMSKEVTVGALLRILAGLRKDDRINKGNFFAVVKERLGITPKARMNAVTDDFVCICNPTQFIEKHARACRWAEHGLARVIMRFHESYKWMHNHRLSSRGSLLKVPLAKVATQIH